MIFDKKIYFKKLFKNVFFIYPLNCEYRMSRNQKPLILSISKKRPETQMASNIERITSERQSQTTITRSFNARRNSGQIERYFIESHSTFCIAFLIVISTLILFSVVIVLVVLPRKIIKDKILEMTEEIVILTQEEIMTLISSDLNLSFFYAFLFSSMMSPPEMIATDLYSARDIVKVFAKAYRTNTNNKIWRLGVSSGRFIGFSTENGIKLYYSRTNGDDIYPLYSWNGDPITYDNSSYPYVFYEQGDAYISYDTQWYMAAENEKRTCWTPLSTGINSENKFVPIISTASPVIDKKTGFIVEVFSIGVHIEQTQLFFDFFLHSAKSRFALLNSQDTKGTIIACTGKDLPYEEINNMLSFKSLLELQDDVWRQVVLTPEFESDENFTFYYNSDLIHCIHVSFEMAPGIKWCFFSAFSVNDIVDADISIIDTWSFVVIFLFAAIWISIEVLIVVMNNAVSVRQSKILKRKEKKDKDTHLKYAGINSSIKLIQRVLLSHADNIGINKNVEIIVDDLVNSPKIPYFDSAGMFNEIENKKVKKKFVEMFGPPQSGLLKSFHKPSRNDLEIVNNYMEKRSTRNPTIYRLQKENNSIEKKLEKAIISRHDMVAFQKEKIIKKVSFYVQSFNLVNPLFDPDQLDIIVHKIMLNIGDQTLPLLYDSIEFAFILMKRNAQALIPDTDYSLALNFALFSYHMSMVNRTRSDLQYINKFFQRSQSKISQDAHSILFGLYNILIDQDQVRLERWEKFKNIVFKLITTGLNIWEHRNAFEKCKLILNVVEGSRSKLTINEAFSILFFIYCSCQVSYYYHSKGDSYTLLSIFIPIDLRPRPKQLAKFINCFTTQYLQPLTVILGDLCGNEFIDWIRNLIETNPSPPANSKIFS